MTVLRGISGTTLHVLGHFVVVALLLIAVASEADAQRRRSDRNRRGPAAERRTEPQPEAPPARQAELPGPPIEEEPSDPAFLAASRLGVQSPSIRERQSPPPPGLTSEQLGLLAPQRRHADALVPLRGYPTSEIVTSHSRPIYADASIGIFATTRLSAGYAGADWPFDYSAAVDLDLSKGHADNPHSRFEADLGLGYIIDEGYGIFSGGHMGIDAQYLGTRYELYGSPGSPERHAAHWSIATTGTNNNDGWTYDASARFRSLTVSDSGASRETSLDGSLTLSSLLGGLTIGGAADVRLTNLDGASISMGLVEAFGSYSTRFLTARAGLGVALGGNTDRNATVALAPSAELRLFPMAGLTLIGAVTGGLVPNSLAELSSVNPYIALGSTIRQLHEKIGYRINLRLEPSRSFAIHATAAQSHYADYAWFGSPVEGLYRPSYDNARVARIGGDLVWSPNEQDRLMVDVQFVESTVGAESIQTPYVPRWTVDVHYTRRIRPMPLTIEGTVHYIGVRPREDGSVMAPAALVGLGAGYLLSANFEIMLELKNMLAQRYELWDGYRERGLFVALGVRTRF